MALYDMSYGDILRQHEGAMSRGKWANSGAPWVLSVVAVKAWRAEE